MIKRLYIAALAALIGLGAGAQDIGKVKALYDAGMYSQAVSELDGFHGDMADGYRVMASLAMKSDNSYALAGDYLRKYSECILAPQVRFLWGLDLFDRERYEDAITLLNSITAKDIPTSKIPEYTYKLGYSAFGTGEWERSKSILRRMR